MPTITIRHSTAADAAAIQAVYAGPLAYSGTLQLPFPTLAKWEARVADVAPGHYSLVAEIDGEVVGQLGLQVMANPRRRHAASIGLAVKDAHQGRGVGSQLLAAAIDLAENWLALTRLELTVFVDNDAAIAVYRKHGFMIEGQSPRYAFRDGAYVDVCHMARLTVR